MNQTLREFVTVRNRDLSRISALYNELEPSAFSPHIWYDSARKGLGDKECTSLIHQPEFNSELSFAMFDVVNESIRDYLAEMPWKVSINNSSIGRFNIYRPGDSMDEHVDHIYTLFTPPERGIPVLSVVGLLNDDFEGGDFTLCGERMDLSAGDIVIFPSCFLYPHSVGTVTAGERVSFVSWAW